jgi:hypothetical protein
MFWKKAILVFFFGVGFFLIYSLWNTCSPDSRVNSKLTHVFMSFIPKQKKMVLKLLSYWKKYPPCLPGSTFEKPVVTFLVSTSKEVDSNLKIDVLARMNEIKSCFKKIEWEEVKLSPEDDFHPKGPRLVFEHMLRKGREPGYDYIMLMEPDVFPIRENWLFQLVSIVSLPIESFWVKGSIYRGKVKIPVCINGAALYRIGDSEFISFYFNKLRKFVERFNNDSKWGYDADFFEYFAANRLEYGKIAHKFQFSDFIQNRGHEAISVAKILEESPHTFLVHVGGRGYLSGDLGPKEENKRLELGTGQT